MNRSVMVVVLTIALVLCPCSLLAQRGGGHGGHGSSAGAPNGVPPETEEMKEFSRGFALQANAPQVSLFQILAKDTVAAKDKVEDLVLHPEKTKDQADILAYVVENALDESHDFLKGLSDAQKSGLKAWKKNVEKADSDVDKCWKTLNQVLVRQKTDDKRIGSDAEKLGKALENLETEQWNLARKMGIQPPPAEGDQRS